MRLNKHEKLLHSWINSTDDFKIKNHFQRVLECGRLHLVLIKDNVLYTQRLYCGSRWCETCASDKSRNMANYLIDQVKQKTLRHFVFTVQNCGYWKLDNRLNKIRIAWRSISKEFQKQDITFIWKIEVTFKKHSCHPHLHFVTDKWIDGKKYFALWKRRVKPLKAVIWHGSLHKTSIRELTKYSTKPSSWKNVDELNLDHIYKALERKRLIGTSRNLSLTPPRQKTKFKCLGLLETLINQKNALYKNEIRKLHEAIFKNENQNPSIAVNRD